MAYTTKRLSTSSRTETRPRSSYFPPADFDAGALPIIAKHWYGIEPFRTIGQAAAEVVADLRFRRQVQRLHKLGPRVIAELLAEIGDRFPRPPLYSVKP